MTFKRLQTIFDKSFKKRLSKASGRNFLGRICVFHQGAGRFSFYRPVDFYRRINLFGRVIRVRRALHRSAFVATILYVNGLVSSIVSAEGLNLGSLVYSGSTVPIAGQKRAFATGSAMPLAFFSLFSLVHNTELIPFRGAQLFRSAGAAATLVARDSVKATLKSASGWLIKVPIHSMATFGQCSNAGHKHERVPKAGANR